MKKALCLIFLVFSSLLIYIPLNLQYCSAEQISEIKLKIGEPIIYIGDSKLEIEVAPLIENSRTYIPIKATIEAIGGKADWNDKERKITITFSDKELTLWLDKNSIVINSKIFAMDVCPKIIKNRAMIPIKYIVENIGYTTKWDQGTVIITKDNRQVITFIDKNLEKAVIESLIAMNKGDLVNKYDNGISVEAYKSITSLSLYDKKITNLDGIEKLLNMTSLTISHNQISDLTPIKNLKNLNKLILIDNNIEDISMLKDLTNLTKLSLNNNKIKDISALENMKQLVSLDLLNNSITNIDALKNLKELKSLMINGNKIEKKDLELLKQALPDCFIDVLK